MRLEDRTDVFFECRWSSREGQDGGKQQTDAYKVKQLDRGARLCASRINHHRIVVGWVETARLFEQAAADLRHSDAPINSVGLPHASFKISFTTRDGFVSVMRSSWPLW